jgi:hypothetical protein
MAYPQTIWTALASIGGIISIMSVLGALLLVIHQKLT